MFENLIAALKADKRKIVFTEGPDARILEAAARLKKDGLMDSILVGNVDEVKAAAAKGGFDIEGMEIIDPATYPEMDAMVAKMVELRKGKMSEEDCRAALSKGNYFGTMLVKMGKADALLGGATYSTADTVRPALQLIKTKPGAHLVSSCVILVREKDGVEEKLAMGDCAINIDYPDSVDKEGNVTLKGSQKLAEVAIETANTAKAFGIDPKVAVLSFSTKASGKGGRIVFTGSVQSFVGSKLKEPYNFAKRGVAGLAKAIAREGAEYGIYTYTICPSFIKTPLVEKQIPEQAASLGITEEEVVKNIMLRDTVDGVFTTVEDVANTLVFLSKDQGALTGQSLRLTHGWAMM